MKALKLFLGIAALTVSILSFTTPQKAHADTFQILDLGSAGTFTNTTTIFGITASGTVVLADSLGASCSASLHTVCYETWVNGVMVNVSTTAPNFVYDNGTPCTVDASFLAFSVPGTCNNGHEVYNAGAAAMTPYTDSTFTGPDVTDLFASAPITVDQVHLNSSGDFAYVISHPAGGPGEIAEAIDLTSDVPEPGSITFLGTGLFAAAGTVGRRLFRYTT